ncbi:glycosyltransferase family 4 protein, partial [Planctomycetota bacterium]
QSRCWEEIIERAAQIDQFVAVSEYYADKMRRQLQLDRDRVKVVYNGLSLQGYQPADTPPPTPTIGYLSRMYPKKGLDVLAEAFVIIKKNQRLRHARLRIAGGQMVTDEAFVKDIKRRLTEAAVIDDVEFLPSFERRQRQEFLRTLSVLSVPARRDEAFGMYAWEALACGVPVVQPSRGVFPELLELTEGGILLPEPIDPAHLATALESLLLDGDRARQLGLKGSKAVFEKLNIDNTVQKLAQIYQKTIANFSGD